MNKWICDAWGLPLSDRFPGPQPVSIERRHFPILKTRPYVVCEKTDGLRYLLVSTPDKTCALVNRSFQVTPVTLNLARGTILDGELVTCRDGRKLFVVHDAIVVRDENVCRLTLLERLEKARSVVRAVIRTPKSPFGLVIKNMVPLEQFDTLPKEFPYETDGLVFTPVDEPIQTGTHETMFKWKPLERITIDFAVTKGRILCTQERGRLIEETEMHVPETYPDGTIVECEYGQLGWKPVKVRTDKTYPNNRRTFFRTLVNIRENIQYDEFKTVP